MAVRDHRHLFWASVQFGEHSRTACRTHLYCNIYLLNNLVRAGLAPVGYGQVLRLPDGATARVRPYFLRKCVTSFASQRYSIRGGYAHRRSVGDAAR
jgi:hypothetical protein